MAPVHADPPWLGIRGRGALAVVLVRHGRTAYNLQRRFVGHTDVPLDDQGRREAAALRPHLVGELSALYCSSLARARQTAEALAPPAPVVLPGIEELDHGALEGLTADEALGRWPDFFARWEEDPETARVPGGETLGEGRDRALAALTTLAERHDGGQVIGVVAHQLVLASVLCTLEGDRLAQWRRYGLPNAGIAVLAWQGGGFRVAAPRWSPGPGGSSVADV